jgi:acyl carrier protein
MTVELQPTRQDRVTNVVAKLLQQRQKMKRPEPGDDLRKAGLSSLDMVKVVLSLEEEFGLTIPEAAITPKNFRSVSTIEALIATLGVTE